MLVLSFRYKLARSILLGIVLCLAGLCLSPAGNSFQELPPYRIAAQRWEEGEKIFRSDSHWLGGDGATSVDLGQGRVLWLFGDSFIDLSGSGVRRTSGLVRNSIAIQTGYDPTSAGMQFFWKMKGTKPAAFFSLAGDHWYWPASGIMISKRLLIFLMEVKMANNVLGFETCGWKAVRIDNPQRKPNQWILTYLKSSQKQGFVIGSGNPVVENGFLQVFATDFRNRAIYLVRWPERSVAAGALVRPQWWAGEKAGWTGSKDTEDTPHSIIAKGQMEFSVAYRPQLKSYLQIQTLSIMNPCLAASAAKTLTGPWSSHNCFFTPPEQGVPNTLIYAGKSHPMLCGADMVFTYIVNTTKEYRLLKDMSIYFPVMLKGRINTEPYSP
jgi:hypothetical protein